MMDMGGDAIIFAIENNFIELKTVYPLSCARFIASSNPIEVKSVSNTLSPTDQKIDTSSKVELQFPNDVTASLYCNFEEPTLFWFIPSMPKTDVVVELESGKIRLSNYPGPYFLHEITVEEKVEGEPKKTAETTYTFNDGRLNDGDYWTT